MTQFSIVVPTLNEADNIDILLAQLFALNISYGSFEVIFIDDGSHDGTPKKIRAWQKKNAQVRLIERHEKPDLVASVLAGTEAANSDVIVVMDADLSHPLDQLEAIVSPVLADEKDIVIGSRYINGGGIQNWPLYRRLLSKAGSMLACPLCDVYDATSGFFAFKRKLVDNVSDNAQGYKILLEMLMANAGKLRVKEIPICFRNRIHGTSKLSFSHQLAYLQRLITLAGGSISVNTAGRFAVVGLLGVIVDVVVFQWMISRDAGLALAHFLSFLVALGFNYILNSKWSFRQHHAGYLEWRQFSRFLIVGGLALLLRGGVLALLVETVNMPPGLAIIPAILIAAVLNYLGSVFYVFPERQHPPALDVRWRVAAMGIILFSLLLRLAYFGVGELIPDEAYYWMYTQHMDFSYYDHPPLVAWLIWLGTSLLGDNEAGVRVGALISSLIALGYLYALAGNLYDKSTALRTLLLFSVLPLGFASGFFMTPDAPLVAAWAATLYYMERALVDGQRSAWLGMGIAFGLGLLSKYTIGLLALAALVFVIIDPVARRWLLRPHPYLAALLALLIFSPVIIWNYQHDWVSFMFQSSRLADDPKFSVHFLLAYIIILLTPIGFLAAVYALLPSVQMHTDRQYQRKWLFMLIFTALPFLVFFIFSTFDRPKFHWNGPLWLVTLPAIAWVMGHADHLGRFAKWLQKGWQVTIIACLFGYAILFHYLVLGIPGATYPLFTEHYFWRQATAEVEKLAEEVEQQTHQKPLVVGMSKWSIASALYFYNHEHKDLDIRSRNVFGQSGAMYDFWYPLQPPANRPIIQIGMTPEQITVNRQGESFAPMLDQPGAIRYRRIKRDNITLRRLYYRISNGFHGT